MALRICNSGIYVVNNNGDEVNVYNIDMKWGWGGKFPVIS